MTCGQQISELLPAYAMGSATEMERRQVEDHLETCAQCRRQLRELETTLEQIAYGAPMHSPPAALRARTLAAIEQAAAQPDSIEERAAKGAAAAHPAPRSPRRRWRRWRPESPSWPAAVAAAMALVFAGMSAALVDRVNDLERRLDDARAVERQDSPVEGPTTLVGQSVTKLTSSGPLERAQVLVGSEAKRSTAVLVIRDLPAPPEGRVWQAWTIDATGAKRSVEVIARGGPLVVITVQLETDGKAVSAIAITPEPAGGSRQPTGVPVAHGQLV